MPPNATDPLNGQRLDTWLWAARFFKTRALAKTAIEGGKVEVNEAPAKPARTLRTGDTVRLRRGDEKMEVIVRAFNEARRPAPEARLLYEETPASLSAREQARLQREAQRANLPPATRPDGHARRELRRLLGKG
ncbi:MAG: S4 domain-containing protein [Halothiobacillaceae bacterium]|nr:S4 domain-containing protein [Halothiobacillaceae bacterium]MDY0050024.1 S4 domain-containing protein [Halothiobacillaceae bacterium]